MDNQQWRGRTCLLSTATPLIYTRRISTDIYTRQISTVNVSQQSSILTCCHSVSQCLQCSEPIPQWTNISSFNPSKMSIMSMVEWALSPLCSSPPQPQSKQDKRHAQTHTSQAFICVMSLWPMMWLPWPNQRAESECHPEPESVYSLQLTWFNSPRSKIKSTWAQQLSNSGVVMRSKHVNMDRSWHLADTITFVF